MNSWDYIRLHFIFAFFGILGFLAREGLIHLTQHQGLLGGVIWANFAGCAIMGFLITHPITHKKASAPLYIGLTTGFCGSLTSLSSAEFRAFQVAAGIAIRFTPEQSPAWGVPAALAYVLLEIVVSTGAFAFGSHVARSFRGRPLLTHGVVLTLELTFSLAGALAWAAAIILTVMSFVAGTRGSQFAAISATWRYWALGMAFAPPAVYMRYWISRLLNPVFWTGRFASGTFACNCLATTVVAAVAIVLYGVGAATLIEGSVRCEVLRALTDGYCGTLSTVSTLVAEVYAMQRLKHKYFYGLASVGIPFALVVVIFGSYIWTNGYQNTVCTI